MYDKLPNCWEIEKCERQKGGSKVHELGECVASIEGMGHSCWAVAGTLCGGEVQGTWAKKIGYCTSCEVHKTYNRSTGSKTEEIRSLYPEEHKKYNEIMLKHSVIL
mgnify:CR=1 FL=1